MGLLDTLSADRLFKRIQDRSGAPLAVDCSGITRTLFESMVHFTRRLDSMAPLDPEKFRLEFQRVPAGMARQLQLLGKPLSGDAVVLYPPETGSASEREDGAWTVQCENCSHSIRIARAGNYACPHCGVRFHVNKFGGASFYESMLNSSRS